ncbi:MAG: amidohydrolase family protein [Acidobacteria bacterium]|jgi:L-fuconolactonase|nr:amidohydrolase family protein [Acidobacteriota bacterium]
MARQEIIDTHQHLWVMSERAYSWIEPAYGPLYDDFTPERLAPEIGPAGVTATVLVQSADTYDDTFYMLDIADRYDVVKGVVGWVPFERPRESHAALEVLTTNKYFKGVRNLTHDYSNPKYESDPAWILRPKVLETLKEIADRDLTMDYVAVNSDHLKNIPVLAEKIPHLRIVIDHFAKPDIANKVMSPWAELMSDCAAHPNVYAKFSGLNTASGPNWTIADWKPYMDHMVNEFGADRIMTGGDWPVAILGNTYTEVWNAQRELIEQYSPEDQQYLFHDTAKSFYNI